MASRTRQTYQKKAKNLCLERGADLRTAQLMPLPLTVSCFRKIQIGFTFLVSAHLGSPGQRPDRMYVCMRQWELWVFGCRVVLWSMEGRVLKQLTTLRMSLHSASSIGLCLRTFPTLSWFPMTSPLILQVVVCVSFALYTGLVTIVSCGWLPWLCNVCINSCVWATVVVLFASATVLSN